VRACGNIPNFLFSGKILLFFLRKIFVSSKHQTRNKKEHKQITNNMQQWHSSPSDKSPGVDCSRRRRVRTRSRRPVEAATRTRIRRRRVLLEATARAGSRRPVEAATRTRTRRRRPGLEPATATARRTEPPAPGSGASGDSGLQP
jgi:hypothetical protein